MLSLMVLAPQTLNVSTAEHHVTLEQFAQQYRLKIKKDSCGDEVILGKMIAGCEPDCHHVYQHGSFLAVYLNFPTKQRWNTARKALEAAGSTALQVGECDGMVRFDGEAATVARLVLKLARCRVKRVLSEEQKAEIRKRLKK